LLNKTNQQNALKSQLIPPPPTIYLLLQFLWNSSVQSIAAVALLSSLLPPLLQNPV